MTFVALALLVPACGKGDKAEEAVKAAGTDTPTTALASSGAPATATASKTTTTARAATTSKASSAPRDPCKAVTQDDAAALAGTAVTEAVASGVGEDRTCTYSGDPSGPTAQVEVFVGPGAKKIYDVDVQLGHEFADVAGVGDEAHIEEFAIFFRVAKDWYAIRLIRLDDFDAYRQPMIDLATKVAKTA